MNIYAAHSSSIEFKEDLYRPLRDSKLDRKYNIVLPHEESDEPFNSKEFLKDECDVFIAEVSKASTGLGIEIGWANLYDIPIICVYKEGSEVSSSIPEIADKIGEYSDSENMIELLTKLIDGS